MNDAWGVIRGLFGKLESAHQKRMRKLEELGRVYYIQYEIYAEVQPGKPKWAYLSGPYTRSAAMGHVKIGREMYTCGWGTPNPIALLRKTRGEVWGGSVRRMLERGQKENSRPERSL